MKPFLILSLVGTLATPIAAAATLSTKAQDDLHHKWVCGLLRAGQAELGNIIPHKGLSHQRTRNHRNRENPGMKTQFETDASKTIRAIKATAR
jgi:hypothetical protein